MARWLLSLSLLTWMSVAAPSLYSLLSQGQYRPPMQVMLQLEQHYPGVITQFDIDVQNGELIYEFNMLDPDAKTTVGFAFKAADGSLLEQKVAKLESDDLEELAAVTLMRQQKLQFSQLVTLATGDLDAYLIEAQLDHDLGISYLELKLLSAAGRHKLAFDIANLRPLPLLKWD
ncbi:PepSY domain-containing protein [Shewanella salipaludis]|uniref:PepSY domain-containing protein n=1 Tax=Shewanella salipaludis TaxID=2723052 RepID=A0A972G2A6_9GAMM|nr:hypothetical protein [Shewanella salipaludis]NMH66196.1 hypothetical protein [Shewanella salipaludis]